MIATAPFRVWFFANFEEFVKPTCAYTTPEAAQHAAVIDYEAGDSGPMFAKVTYEWRTSDNQPDQYVLFEDGVFTGYWVQPLEVVGERFEIEWTVARRWRHSIEYGAYAMSESLARDEVREELECGAQASVAYRFTGQWRHEDPEAQRHADAIDAVLKTGAK